MIEKLKKINYINYFTELSINILLFVCTTFLISVASLLLHINITRFHFITSLVLTEIIHYIIRRKDYDYKKELIHFLIFIIVLLICLFVTSKFFDISYDGVWYHLRCIIRLKNGWNPIYELINTGNWGDYFMDSYPCKASWIFGANVYALTNNLNSVNILPALLGIATFGISLKYFSKLLNNKYHNLLAVIFSIIISFNPVFLMQVFTNYLDSSLGSLLIIYFLLLSGYFLNIFDNKNRLFKILIIILIALMMNMKLTGLFYAAIFYFIFYLLSFKRIIKPNFLDNFKNIFITGLIGVLLGLFLGINPYITNVMRGHNPFYPIVGADKLDVMGENVPTTMRQKSNLEKLMISNLSNTTNSITPSEYWYKNPFRVSSGEIKEIQHDTKIGGFGPLFPLVCYMTICVGLFLIWQKYKGKLTKLQQQSIILSITIFGVAIIFGESWWARYYVLLWLIPIFISLVLIISNHIVKKVVGCSILIVMIFNMLIVGYGVYQRQISYSRPIAIYVDGLKDKDSKIVYSVSNENFEYTYDEYFKINNIQAKLVRDITSPDFKGINISIKEINN